MKSILYHDSYSEEYPIPYRNVESYVLWFDVFDSESQFPVSGWIFFDQIHQWQIEHDSILVFAGKLVYHEFVRAYLQNTMH